MPGWHHYHIYNLRFTSLFMLWKPIISPRQISNKTDTKPLPYHVQEQINNLQKSSFSETGTMSSPLQYKNVVKWKCLDKCIPNIPFLNTFSMPAKLSILSPGLRISYFCNKVNMVHCIIEQSSNITKFLN